MELLARGLFLYIGQFFSECSIGNVRPIGIHIRTFQLYTLGKTDSYA